jgi:transglutaminase-like putative cysteine protease
VGGERNPYAAAGEIYNWILREIKFTAGPLKGGVEEALRNREADSYMAALLFCSLCRAAGIPALPVAGVLVDRNRSTVKHYWAEFWIEGLGWLPADCALGAGAVPPSFNERNDRISFYFGNLDNQRIVFSRDQAFLSPMDPRGRTAARTRDYAFQNIWEEASGGLESYSSFWGDITITGIYAQ